MSSLCLTWFTTIHGCWQSISSYGMVYAQLLGVVCHNYWSEPLGYHTNMCLVHNEHDFGVQIFIYYLWMFFP